MTRLHSFLKCHFAEVKVSCNMNAKGQPVVLLKKGKYTMLVVGKTLNDCQNMMMLEGLAEEFEEYIEELES